MPIQNELLCTEESLYIGLDTQLYMERRSLITIKIIPSDNLFIIEYPVESSLKFIMKPREKPSTKQSNC